MLDYPDKVDKFGLQNSTGRSILKRSFILKHKHSDMEGNNKNQPHRDDDWKLEGQGQEGDPNLNVCESCQ